MPHQETNPNRHTDGLTRLYTALKERSVTPSEDAWSRLAVIEKKEYLFPFGHGVLLQLWLLG
jgi:hypothetical protein